MSDELPDIDLDKRLIPVVEMVEALYRRGEIDPHYKNNVMQICYLLSRSSDKSKIDRYLSDIFIAMAQRKRIKG